MPTQTFDDFAPVYDALVDWPRRLAAETPHLRRLVEESRATRVLDAACGPGHHAGLLHQWGLEVEGADLSPAMIARARERFGQAARLRWIVRGFQEPVTSGPFDLCLCLGNSLALAPDKATARTAIARLLEATRPGGRLVVQVLNLWRLEQGRCLWQRHCRTRLPQGDSLIIKGVHRAGDCGYVELLVSLLEGPEPTLRTESARWLGFTAEELRDFALAGGAGQVEVFGSYARDPYDPARSTDLVLLAQR